MMKYVSDAVDTQSGGEWRPFVRPEIFLLKNLELRTASLNFAL